MFESRRTIFWGCSSAGRASALQAGGQGFDPPQLHSTRRHGGSLMAGQFVGEANALSEGAHSDRVERATTFHSWQANSSASRTGHYISFMAGQFVGEANVPSVKIVFPYSTLLQHHRSSQPQFLLRRFTCICGHLKSWLIRVDLYNGSRFCSLLGSE